MSATQAVGARAPRLFASEQAIETVALGLLDRTLPKAAWTHEAHFAATLWLLAHRPDLDLARALPGLIRAYNVATGGENTDTAGYHETITQASLRAARAFAAASPGRDVCATVNALLVSPLGDPAWLFDHWSRPRLFSVDARRSWVDPNLRELPF